MKQLSSWYAFMNWNYLVDPVPTQEKPRYLCLGKGSIKKGGSIKKVIENFMNKIICLEWSNMSFKHDIVLSLKQFRTLDPHPSTV